MNTMKTASLPRWLARLFTFLFYGQIVGYVLAGCLIVWIRHYKPASFQSQIAGLHMPLHGRISVPTSDQSIDKTIRNWNASPPAEHTLNVGLHMVLGRTKLVDDTYWLKFSVNKWTDSSRLLLAVLLLTALGGVFSLFLGLYICYLFMRLFQRLADQQIFDQIQTQRLMRVGQSLLLYATLTFVCQLVAQEIIIHYLQGYGYVVQRFPTVSISAEPSTEFIALLTGLCILALAQVFKYGMELKQESELTI